MNADRIGITVLNFAHPITAKQQDAIAAMAGQPVDHVIDVPSQLDLEADVETQVSAIVESCGLTSYQWQTLPILVNLPALSVSAGVVLSEISGRCGFLPSVLFIHRSDGLAPKFEVAGIVNLQRVRDQARRNRSTVDPAGLHTDLNRGSGHEQGE